LIFTASNVQANPPFRTRPNAWQGADYVPGEVIIKFKENIPENRRQGMAARLGLRRMRRNNRMGTDRFRIPHHRKMQEFIEECRKDPDIEYVEPNYLVHLHYTPNDEFFSYQWNLDNPGSGGINMKSAWNVSKGSPNVVVAIVDTGIAYEDFTDVINSLRSEEYYLAPELAQTSFAPGYDFVDNDDHPNDDNGHGTHVAGTVAQSTNNFSGVAGVAFQTTLMPVKVINDNGYGSSFDVADGIIWAADHGAQIINLSLGSRFSSTTIRNACQYATEQGVTLVCSSGNDSRSELGYPARYDDYCIAVGATRYDETRSYYSNFGEGLDLVAPGGDLTVDQNGDGIVDGILQQTFIDGDRANFNYYLFQGTSMSAPHVSGVAALLIAAGVATTPAEIRAALQNTARDLGAPGWDAETGWGLLDAQAALNYSGEPSPPG
ncbi:MAG: S8 family peptidase, partial [Candidatus Omnitrophica bacterium]|nr:S8 family peptidase [Candidatus Omnitrophota bacterium]